MALPDAETMTEELNSILSITLDKHAPITETRCKLPVDKMFFTKKLTKMRKTQRRLGRRFKKTQDPEDLIKYKMSLSVYKLKFKKTRAGFFNKKLASSSDDPRKNYDTLNYLLNRNCASNAPATEDVAEKFSAFFTEKIKSLRNTFPSCRTLEPLGGCAPVAFSAFQPVSPAEAVAVINSSKKCSSPADPIPTDLFCFMLPVLGPVVTAIINASLCQRNVPFSFKKAIVKPLLKKPSLAGDVLFQIIVLCRCFRSFSEYSSRLWQSG